MLQALVLGAIQGLTEFVPISSSAHLVLVPFLAGWQIPSLGFDVAIHIGTTLALIVYFRQELVAMAAGVVRSLAGRGQPHDREMVRLVLLLAIASVPAVLAGVLLEGFFEGLYEQPHIVSVELLVTAAMLLGAEGIYGRRDPGVARDLSRVGVWDAVVMGLLQATAIFPGVSRSGATISGGLVRGLTRDAAARFAFLLGLPSILGAGLYKAGDIPPGTDVGTVVAASAVAGAVGFATIALLIRYLRTRTMRPFAWYCVALAVVSLAYWFQLR